MRFDFLLDSSTNSKGAAMLRALRAYAAFNGGARMMPTSRYVPSKGCVALLYGPGSNQNKELIARIKSVGGNYVAFDLGYFNRSNRNGGYPLRLTFNAPHPLEEDLRDHDQGQRWRAERIHLREDYDPNGHIVIAGTGRKSRVQYGFTGANWELEKLRDLRRRYPDADIRYRPKKTKDTLPGTTLVPYEVPIEESLKGARLLCCHHSNVAVDACIAGVPVECANGAAYHLYKHSPNPSPESRLRFLQQLAWLQWRPSEAKECWKFIQARFA